MNDSQGPILRELLGAVEARVPVVVATVVATSRSVPRRAGSKMLVYGDGRISGTVGGGEMEARVVAESLDALATGAPRRLNYSLLDPATGDPGVCGGDVELYLEPHMPQSTIFVVGAGHVGRAVIDLARWLGHRIIAWDDRSELVDDIPAGAAFPPGAEGSGRVGGESDLLLAGPFADAVAHIDRATRVVMVTRNVALDVDLLPLLLATDAPYIGLMGSTRRWDTTRKKLVDLGLDAEQLARVTAPIGLEISAETPAEIAVSIMAEVIGAQRGNEG